MKTKDVFAMEMASLLLNYGVVRLSPDAPFTWASGMKSPIYCNNRDLLSLAADNDRDKIIEQLIEAVTGLCSERDKVVFVGVATGAIPWGAMVAYSLGVPYGYVISAPKKHGADSDKSTPEEEKAQLAKCLIGKFPEDAKVVIIEDLISTGASSLHAVKAVRAAGYEVAGMLALFSYGFKEAEDAFFAENCEVITLSNYGYLIAKALEMCYISSNQKRSLRKWRENPHAWSQARGGK